MTNNLSQYTIPFGRNELFIVVWPGRCLITQLTTENYQLKPKEEDRKIMLTATDMPYLLQALVAGLLYMTNTDHCLRARIGASVEGVALFLSGEEKVHGNTNTKRIYLHYRSLDQTTQDWEPLNSSNLNQCIFQDLQEVIDFSRKIKSVCLFVFGQSLEVNTDFEHFISVLLNTQNGKDTLDNWSNYSTTDPAKNVVLTEMFNNNEPKKHFFNWHVTTFILVYKTYFQLVSCLNEL